MGVFLAPCNMCTSTMCKWGRHNLGELGLEKKVLRCFFLTFTVFFNVPLVFLRYCHNVCRLIPGWFLSISQVLLLWFFSISEGVSHFWEQAVGVPVGRHLGGWLAMMLVATINVLIFFLFSPFPPSSTFQIDGVLR